MGRFHKTYEIKGDVRVCKEIIEAYLQNRGYRKSEQYYDRPLFLAYDSALPTILGADNHMRFVDVSLQGERIVVEAWILKAWAVAGDRSWNNPAFITRLDKNEIDPTEEAKRCKAKKRDLLTLLEDVVAITEEYNLRGRVDAAFLLPSGFCLCAECDDLPDFIKSIAPPSVTSCLVKQSVFVYAMAFFAVVAAITTSSWADIVQIALIVLLTVLMQVKKDKSFAVALFALCVGEVLLPFFFTSSSNWVTWFLLIDAYLALNCFKNTERMFELSTQSLQSENEQ